MSLPSPRYRVVLTDSAEDDLIGVAEWYADRHPSGEERFFEASFNSRNLLASQPRIGRERPEFRAGLRSWYIHPYVMFYEVDDGEETVTVERVIHGHVDIGEDDFED